MSLGHSALSTGRQEGMQRGGGPGAPRTTVTCFPEEALMTCSQRTLTHQYSVVQSLSCVQLFAIPWTLACQASLSFTISWSLLKLMSVESMMPSNQDETSPVVPFSSCFQSFPASGSFLMSWLFALGGQSVGASASASVLPMNIQG